MGKSLSSKSGNDCVETPKTLARAIVNHFNPIGKILEPCRGDGNFLSALPPADWCEIKEGKDFLSIQGHWDWIITNPPYSIAQDFIEHSLFCAEKKVIMLLKLVFLESISRKKLFDKGMLKKVYVFRKRLKIYANGIMGKNSGLIAYAWFIWEKDYNGLPTIDWI